MSRVDPTTIAGLIFLGIAGCTTLSETGSGSAESLRGLRLVAPDDGATLTTACPVFEWKPPRPAAVQICSDAACTSVVRQFAGLDGIGSPDPCLAEGAYFWRAARMRGGEIVGDWTTTRSFTIDLPGNPGAMAWARRAGGTDGDPDFGPGEKGSSIAALASGDVGAAGDFMGTATFGAGESSETTLTSAGDTDGFVARYRAGDGSLVWVRAIHGTGIGQYVQAIGAMPDGGVAISGTVGGPTTFGAGEANETTIVGQQEQIFVARYAADGRFLWVKLIQEAFGFAWGLSVAADGSIYVTGRIGTTALFGAGEPNETRLEGTPVGAIFFARFFADGSLAWARAVGPSGGTAAVALADGGAVFVGWLRYPTTFGAGEPNETLLAPSTAPDTFVARYRADGTLGWAKLARGGSQDFVMDVAALPSGDVVITGELGGETTFGPGEPNATVLLPGTNLVSAVFVARYRLADGELVWARAAPVADHGRGEGIAAHDDDSATITGEFDHMITFADGVSLTSAAPPDRTNGFVATYSGDGVAVWARRAGGSDGSTVPLATTDVDGGTTITGYFTGTTVFGAGEPGAITLTSAGLTDIFLARYPP